MCKTQALRHQCGHSKLRVMSSCRGTYASPNTKAPLCNAGPSLTVAIEDKCQDCLYNDFRSGWQSRIAEAEAKQMAARQLIVEFQNDNCCSELDNSPGGLIGSDNLTWGNAEAAFVAERKASREAEKLRKQFRKEQSLYWSSYITAPWSGRHVQSKRKRSSSPKSSGESPLRQVVALEEIPEQPVMDDLPPLDPDSSESDVEDESEADSPTDLPTIWSTTGGSLKDIDVNTTSWPKITQQDHNEVKQPRKASLDAMLPAY